MEYTWHNSGPDDSLKALSGVRNLTAWLSPNMLVFAIKRWTQTTAVNSRHGTQTQTLRGDVAVDSV